MQFHASQDFNIKSSRESPSPGRESMATAANSIKMLKAKYGFDDQSNTQIKSLTQRSGNFTSAMKRHAKSSQRGV